MAANGYEKDKEKKAVTAVAKVLRHKHIIKLVQVGLRLSPDHSDAADPVPKNEVGLAGSRKERVNRSHDAFPGRLNDFVLPAQPNLLQRGLLPGMVRVLVPDVTGQVAARVRADGAARLRLPLVSVPPHHVIVAGLAAVERHVADAAVPVVHGLLLLLRDIAV